MIRSLPFAAASACLAFAAYPQEPSDPVRDRLAELVRPANPAARLAALRDLGARGASAGPAVPLIGELLADANPGVRDAAAAALLQLGAHAGAALPALLGHLSHDDPAIRRAARALLDVLAPLRPRTPDELRSDLASGEPDRWRRALDTIAQPGAEHAELLADVAALLSPPGTPAAQAAAQALRTLGDRRAVPHLVRLARSTDDDRVRGPCLELALAATEPDASDPELDALCAKLALGQGTMVAATAVRALAERAVFRPELTEPLLRVVERADVNRRQNALAAWANAGAPTESVVPFLVARLGDRQRPWSVPTLLEHARALARR